MKRLAIVAIAICMALGASGQQQMTSGNTAQADPTEAVLVSVKVAGSQHFAEQDIVTASGLKIGGKVSPPDFKVAADRLSSTGAFEQVEYKYEPAGPGYAITFRVVDAEDFLPVSFDNFVWFSEQQISEAIRERVPLFHGEIASGGPMVNKVTDALQNLLVSHDIPGHVEFETEGSYGAGTQDGQIHRGVFTVDGVNIRIAKVQFRGARQEDVPVLQQASAKLTGTDYRAGFVRSFADKELKPLFLERGYLKVKFGEPEVKLLNEAPQSTVVEVSVPVDEGQQYRLAGVTWSGAKVFHPEDLGDVLRQKNGQVINAIQLKEDLGQVWTMYASKGFLRADVESIPTFNDAANTVAYEMRVQEGQQYRFRSIDLEGLGRNSLARLRGLWKLREDEPYDMEYERQFVKDAAHLLPPNVSIEMRRDINDETRMVDVSIKFQVHADKVIH